MGFVARRTSTGRSLARKLPFLACVVPLALLLVGLALVDAQRPSNSTDEGDNDFNAYGQNDGNNEAGLDSGTCNRCRNGDPNVCPKR